ncbi:hypothetical protein BD769DRAFT_1521692, partial [Suillus cothurnatus]
MALDFLSAPASSADAERAFSGGRLQVNHLQHGIIYQLPDLQIADCRWIVVQHASYAWSQCRHTYNAV